MNILRIFKYIESILHAQCENYDIKDNVESSTKDK